MHSELMWGENYGDTIRVTLWWTFYLRSETHKQRQRAARTPGWQASKDKVTG